MPVDYYSFPPLQVGVWPLDVSGVPGYDEFHVLVRRTHQTDEHLFHVYHEIGPAGPYYHRAIAQEILHDLAKTAEDPQTAQKRTFWHRADAPPRIKEAAATYGHRVMEMAPHLSVALEANDGRGFLDLDVHAGLLDEDRDPATSASNAKLLLYGYGLPDWVRLFCEGANHHVVAYWTEAEEKHDFRGFTWGGEKTGADALENLENFFEWLGVRPRVEINQFPSCDPRPVAWRRGRKAWDPEGRPGGEMEWMGSYLKGRDYGLER